LRAAARRGGLEVAGKGCPGFLLIMSGMSLDRECNRRLHGLQMAASRDVTGDYINLEAWAMAARHLSWFEGWRLFAVLALTLIALCLWIAGMRQFEVEGVRMVVRFTARSSLLLFCLAFGAAALARLWPSGGTRWLRRNRRAIGGSFAASHGLHAIALAAFATMDGAGFAAATTPASYVFGGIGYAVILAMTATSFDRTAQAIGPRACCALHLTGGYYLWFQFMVSFGMRIPGTPLYGLFLIPLLAVMALRLIAMASARTARTA
jgi:sulfoxide reductase heme-binding subunit YedZ